MSGGRNSDRDAVTYRCVCGHEIETARLEEQTEVQSFDRSAEIRRL